MDSPLNHLTSKFDKTLSSEKALDALVGENHGDEEILLSNRQNNGKDESIDFENIESKLNTDAEIEEPESPIEKLRAFSQSTTPEFLVSTLSSWFCGSISMYILYQVLQGGKLWHDEDMILLYSLFCTLSICIYKIVAGKVAEYRKLYSSIERYVEEYHTKSIQKRKMEYEFISKNIETNTLYQELEKQSQQLQERKSWLELVLKASSGSIWEWNISENAITVSEEWYQLLGYDNSQLLIDVNQWYDFVYKGDKEYVQSALDNFLYEPYDGKILEVSYRLICKNATLLWVRSRGVMKCDSNGNILKIVGTNYDVHELYTAENKVRAQQERFYNLLNSITDVYCELDTLGTIINISPSVENHTGHPISYFVGKCIFDYLDNQTKRQLKYQLLKYGKAEDFSLTIEDSKGDIVYARANISTVTLSDGSTMVIGIIRNETARVLAQRTSDYNEHLLIEAQRIAKLGSFELNSATGKFSLSAQLKQILGISEEVVTPPFLDIVIPDDKDRVSQQWGECILSSSSTFTSDFRIYHAKGSIIFVRCVADIEYDEETNLPSNIVGALQDITELKTSLEQQLQLTSIIEATPNIVAMVNIEGDIIYMNKQGIEQMKVDKHQVIGAKFIGLFSDDEKDSVVKEYIPHAIKHGTWQGETTWLYADGTVVPMQQIIIAHKSSSGYLSYLSTIAVDISDSKKVQEAMLEAKLSAESASRAKSAFLSSMSHELRTPLNSILGFAQLLTRDDAIPQLQRKHIDIMYRSGQHLLEMINDVLDISKIEANHLELHPNEFDLYTLVRDVEDMLAMRATEKGLKFECNVDTSIPRIVIGDAMRLRQVLINLLSNAIKYTVHGSVELKIVALPNLSESPASIAMRFDVVDTGRGIPRDQLSDIFKPFIQVRGVYSEGTGLGLAISSRIVGLMGSRLEVESTVGIGTRFYFTTALRLPISNDRMIPAQSTISHQSQYNLSYAQEGSYCDMLNFSGGNEGDSDNTNSNGHAVGLNRQTSLKLSQDKVQIITPSLSEVAKVIHALPNDNRLRLIEAIDLQLTDDIVSIIQELHSSSMTKNMLTPESKSTLQYIHDIASMHSFKALSDLNDAIGSC